MLEQKIEAYFTESVKNLGGKAYKFISPGNAGTPDRLVCLPGGKMFFVELKAPKGRLSKLQEARIDELRRLYVPVFVADSIASVDRVIQDVKSAPLGQPPSLPPPILETSSERSPPSLAEACNRRSPPPLPLPPSPSPSPPQRVDSGQKGGVKL